MEDDSAPPRARRVSVISVYAVGLIHFALDTRTVRIQLARRKRIPAEHMKNWKKAESEWCNTSIRRKKLGEQQSEIHLYTKYPINWKNMFIIFLRFYVLHNTRVIRYARINVCNVCVVTLLFESSFESRIYFKGKVFSSRERRRIFFQPFFQYFEGKERSEGKKNTKGCLRMGEGKEIIRERERDLTRVTTRARSLERRDCKFISERDI